MSSLIYVSQIRLLEMVHISVTKPVLHLCNDETAELSIGELLDTKYRCGNEVLPRRRIRRRNLTHDREIIHRPRTIAI